MIKLPEQFDDLRPYYQEEIPFAMKRISDDPLLPIVLKYLGKEEQLAIVKSKLANIQSTEQLQKEVMYPLCKLIISKTISEFTYSGISNAITDEGQLFISNHRDIVMDAYLQQMALLENGIPTSHITFGSNLMEPQFVVDVGLSNKMFKTVRKSNDFESFMSSSIHLSEYINYVVAHGESLWIAQRNGRTKDGHDKTEPGLIRMLLLGGKKKETLTKLNITPVAVSYQWEPCAILKAVELYKSRGGTPYQKAKGEDLNSIITGITSNKGGVHISICKPIKSDSFSQNIGRSDMNLLVKEIDKEIFAGYKIWDTNYVAYDILLNTSEHKDLYDNEIKEKFISLMNYEIEKYPELDGEALSQLYLNIYAGPVITAKQNIINY